MCHRLLASASFHDQLLVIDRDLAERARQGRCSVCGGPLHVADYPRKVRGVPEYTSGDEHDRRYSFCCGADNCRKRLTPISVRFLDRRVYSSVVVVIATVLAHGLSGRRLRALSAELSVDRRTIERWRHWWRESLPASDCWRALRGRFAEPVDTALLPKSLLDRMVAGAVEERLISLLRLAAPLSRSALMRARCSMVD